MNREAGRALLKVLRPTTGDDEEERAAEIAEIHPYQRDIVSTLIALRCFDSAELAYIGGAFLAATLAALSAARHEMYGLLDADDDDDVRLQHLQGASLRRLSGHLAERTTPQRQTLDALDALSSLERRYVRWQEPLSDDTVEGALRRQGERDGQRRNAIADANIVLRADALVAITAAYRLLNGEAA